MRLLIKGFSEQVLLDDMESVQRCLIVLNEETGEQVSVSVGDDAVSAIARLAVAAQPEEKAAAPSEPQVRAHEWEAPQLDVEVDPDEDTDRGESQL
tara:strand:+ start:240 stop:527 length:288 start_codon:yes stop_codon:yes gene_type:complete